MTQRKKYVVDKRFQLKAAFSVLGVVYLAAAAIIAAAGVIVTIHNNRLDNIVVLYGNNVDALLTFTQEVPGASEKLPIQNIARAHDRNVAEIQTIIRRNNAMLFGIVGFVAALGAVLFILLIRRTHRISGPVYVISNHMKDIIAGRHPEFRPLRKNDELQDFYALFREMAETIRRRSE